MHNMTTIDKGQQVLTLINVFTVAPEKQDELVKLLVDATQQTMKHLPGFVSANIHRSLDGRRVVNYAQWKSLADFEAMSSRFKGVTPNPSLNRTPAGRLSPARRSPVSLLR